MSRNSKSKRLIREAKQVSANRKAGNKGPAKTASAHGKRAENCLWYQKKHNIVSKRRQKKADVEASVEVEAS